MTMSEIAPDDPDDERRDDRSLADSAIVVSY
jgi:hypothetical protein